MQVLKSIHVMELPREVIVGTDAIHHVPEACREIARGNILVVSGPHTIEIAGKRVANLIKSSLNGRVYTEIVQSSTIEEVKRVVEVMQRKNIKLALAVGGGKVIDVVKLASTKSGIDFISVPTSASNDGIASPFASILKDGRRRSFKAQMPYAVIADVSIIGKAPYRLFASGCADVISNYTAVRDWKLAYMLRNEYYGEYAAMLAELSAEIVMRNAELLRQYNELSIRTLLEALISSGVSMGIAGSSRPASGSEHLFAKALEMMTDKGLHGELCGLGTIMMACLHNADWKRVKRALATIGCPTVCTELGIPPEYVIKALTICHKIRPNRYTILGEKGLTWEAAERLAKMTGVIP